MYDILTPYSFGFGNHPQWSNGALREVVLLVLCLTKLVRNYDQHWLLIRYFVMVQVNYNLSLLHGHMVHIICEGFVVLLDSQGELGRFGLSHFQVGSNCIDYSTLHM